MGEARQTAKPVERLDWRSPAGASIASHSKHSNGGIDWTHWLRGAERNRRLLLQSLQVDSPGFKPFKSLPPAYFASATFSSFRLDGIDTSEREVSAALGAGPHRQMLRSRAAQRIRNHISVLRHIESSIRIGESLKASAVMRWYTTVGCGLINSALPDSTMDRLDEVVRRINSPQLRLQPAINDVARLHVQLLADPLVPSFNGLLARLLLRYHLGRSGLPPVVFDPNQDAPRLLDETMLLSRLLELIDVSYGLLLRNGEA